MGTEVEEESRPASDAVYDAVTMSEWSASAQIATLHRGGRGGQAISAVSYGLLKLIIRI